MFRTRVPLLLWELAALARGANRNQFGNPFRRERSCCCGGNRDDRWTSACDVLTKVAFAPVGSAYREIDSGGQRSSKGIDECKMEPYGSCRPVSNAVSQKSFLLRKLRFYTCTQNAWTQTWSRFPFRRYADRQKAMARTNCWYSIKCLMDVSFNEFETNATKLSKRTLRNLLVATLPSAIKSQVPSAGNKLTSPTLKAEFFLIMFSNNHVVPAERSLRANCLASIGNFVNNPNRRSTSLFGVSHVGLWPILEWDALRTTLNDSIRYFERLSPLRLNSFVDEWGKLKMNVSAKVTNASSSNGRNPNIRLLTFSTKVWVELRGK